MQYQDDGISPQTAGLMMGVIALLGLGMFALVYLMNQKSNDPMYDLNDPARQTSPRVQETPDLFRRKGAEEEPAAAAPAPKAPELPPVVIKRSPEPEPAKPATTEPSR